MTKKKKLKIALLIGIPVFVIIAVVVAVVIIIDQGIIPGEPFYLTDLDPSEVQYISIWDPGYYGNTKAKITDEEAIERIINNFNSVKVQRKENYNWDDGITPPHYEITIYLKDESKEIIEYSSDLTHGINDVEYKYHYDILEGEVDCEYLYSFLHEARLNELREKKEALINGYESCHIQFMEIIDAESNTLTRIENEDEYTLSTSLEDITVSVKDENKELNTPYKYIILVHYTDGSIEELIINDSKDIKSPFYTYTVHRGAIDLPLIESMIEKYRNSDILE